MLFKLTKKKKLWLGGLLSLTALLVGVFGSAASDAYISHKDYDQIASCLQKHGFEIKDSWKYTDEDLEMLGVLP
ncbi:MAG: hypothetical protein AAGC93_26055 [Cyanobacteria bacterium P01_F01_bin.53]